MSKTFLRSCYLVHCTLHLHVWPTAKVHMQKITNWNKSRQSRRRKNVYNNYVWSQNNWLMTFKLCGWPCVLRINRWMICLQGAEGGDRRVVLGGAVQTLWARSAEQWCDQTDNPEQPEQWVRSLMYSNLYSCNDFCGSSMLVGRIYAHCINGLLVFLSQATDKKFTEHLSATESERSDTPKSNRSAILNAMDGAKRKG